MGTEGCAANGVLASCWVRGGVSGGVPVGWPPAAALAQSVAGEPDPVAAECTDGLPAEPEFGLEPDDSGELGLLMPGEPEEPPTLGPGPDGAAGAGPGP